MGMKTKPNPDLYNVDSLIEITKKAWEEREREVYHQAVSLHQERTIKP